MLPRVVNEVGFFFRREPRLPPKRCRAARGTPTGVPSSGPNHPNTVTVPMTTRRSGCSKIF